jgi:hypothetical protein
LKNALRIERQSETPDWIIEDQQCRLARLNPLGEIVIHWNIKPLGKASQLETAPV